MVNKTSEREKINQPLCYGFHFTLVTVKLGRRNKISSLKLMTDDLMMQDLQENISEY